jgi:hypothetical protein
LIRRVGTQNEYCVRVLRHGNGPRCVYNLEPAGPAGPYLDGSGVAQQDPWPFRPRANMYGLTPRLKFWFLDLRDFDCTKSV